ncbi:MAG: glycosyltransferase [Burkholderiaceae bacterium]|nr:glycosyltransferase [Burkholderiaceae bacterium]
MNLIKSLNYSQKEEPLVSVCVPVYNHKRFVEECLHSIINQSYKNIELIVIDDGSRDGSAEVINKLIDICERRFVRFKFICRVNKGLCRTLNEALDWCQGDFFCVLASDDAWYPEKTLSQVQVFYGINKDVAVVAAELQPIDEYGNILGKVNRPAHLGRLFEFNDVILGNAKIPAPAAMIRMSNLREIGKYDEESIVEDFYMWLSLTSIGYKIFLSPLVVCKYRVHGDNTNTKVRIMHQHVARLICKFSQNIFLRDKALQVFLYRAFVSSAVHDKRYAVNILFRQKLNIFQLNMIAPVVLLLMPKKLIPVVRFFVQKMKFKFTV